MNRFTAKNKIIICVILLLTSIIITNCGNFSNKQENTSKINVLNDSKTNKNTSNLPKNVEITIKYHIPPEIYNSKDELFQDFISYLYNYIVTEHATKGIAHLQSLGINSVEDALKVCKDWNENDSTGLPLVGKAFSSFFLYNKAGGSFNDQKDKEYFVGYCLKENRFESFLYFLKTFFYHFRIDEGYTIIHDDGSVTNPEGSDFFASSYASIIDTAKFFYYDKESLPYYFNSLKHIPELYNKIPGVLKTPFNKEQIIEYDTTLDEGIKLYDSFDCYGYKFIGWTENDGLLTDPIDTINNSIIEKHISDNSSDKLIINLYGKFDLVGDFAKEPIHDSYK